VEFSLHLFVVDLSAGAEIGFSVCKKIVGAKLNNEIPANVGVRPLQFAGVSVAFEEVSVSSHQFV
jgi:hypothetical protein